MLAGRIRGAVAWAGRGGLCVLLSLVPMVSSSAAPEEAKPYRAALLVEPETGRVLFEDQAHTPYPPASMVKMMTVLVVLDMVKRGALSLEETVVASAHAARMGGSQVYLKQGEKFTVRELLEAVMIHSANDASVALAEHVAGTAEEFVDMMNEKAQELGLKETVYHSVHGLPPEPGQEDDLMSAYDLALLARALLKYPEAAEWGAMKTKPFRGGAFTLYNPNRLLGRFPGVDGVKTGYHRGAGFCVTATAKRGDLRLITVIMGSQRREDCFGSAAKLLRTGFSKYRIFTVAKRGELLGAKLAVKDGVARQVDAIAMEDLKALVERGSEKRVQVALKTPPGGVPAPLEPGVAVASAALVLDGAELAEVPIAPASSVARASIFLRLLRKLEPQAK